MSTSYHPLPQPDEIPVREREDAMGAYLMMFASLAAGLPLPIINLIAAIIYFYVNRSKSRFVYFHSLQSLYSQFPTSILNAGMVFWTFQIIIFERLEANDMFYGYIAATVFANLLYFIFSIVAAIKARKGQMYYFVFFGKLAYQQVYQVRVGDAQSNAPVNKPPSI